MPNLNTSIKKQKFQPGSPIATGAPNRPQPGQTIKPMAGNPGIKEPKNSIPNKTPKTSYTVPGSQTMSGTPDTYAMKQKPPFVGIRGAMDRAKVGAKEAAYDFANKPGGPGHFAKTMLDAGKRKVGQFRDIKDLLSGKK